MSYPDPNNPYSQPPQQPPGQPYGYPQQPPAQPPGYGYPQQPPAAPYGAYPGGNPMPMAMPGLMQAARVILFVIAGLQILGAIIMGVAIAAVQDASDSVGTGDATDGLAGLGFLFVLLLLAFAGLAIFLGVKFSSGGSGIRVTTIVYASLILLGGIGNFASGQNSGAFSGIVGLAVGGILLAAMVNSQASAWFNRPRY